MWWRWRSWPFVLIEVFLLRTVDRWTHPAFPQVSPWTTLIKTHLIIPSSSSPINHRYHHYHHRITSPGGKIFSSSSFFSFSSFSSSWFPIIRDSHLAANPGAVVGQDAYTEYAKVGTSPSLYLYLNLYLYLYLYLNLSPSPSADDYSFWLKIFQGRDEEDSERILTFAETPNEEYPLYPAG